MFQGFQYSTCLEVGASVSQRKWRAFCEGLSENQGRVAGGKGQISDNTDGGWLPVAGL